MTHIATSICRSCGAYCPVDVTIDGDKVIKVEGAANAPVYDGFICPKGRGLAAAHNDRERLTHSLKRMPDGSYVPISSAQLVEEIATKLGAIIATHGPSSVVGYLGGPSTEQQAASAMMYSFLLSIGAGPENFYGNGTIDQPGVMITDALHGTWEGGRVRPDACDVFLIVGGNPIISKQYFGQNPGQQLKRMLKRGTKLVVIDPRRSETARKAHVHLQGIPGEDPTIIAGLIHLVIENGHADRDFVALNTSGFEALREAVRDFTPDYVAQRAGIDEAALRKAAAIIGTAKRGDFGTGVGPSMATRGTLTTYLVRCLQTLRGFWAAEGDVATHPRVLMPRLRFKAQPQAPRPAWGFGKTTRVRGLQMTTAGMPAAALPEEILTPGPGQVRALFLQANAMANWPQTELVKQALDSLDLLVVHDVELSATARVAHYVIATHKQFEIAGMSQFIELVGLMHPGYGWDEPYASWCPPIVPPPAGSDLMEAWQIYYRVARKLGIPLRFSGFFDDPATATALDMQHEPTTDALYELMCRGSAVPLAEVRAHPGGKVFDAAREIVGPRDADCSARLDLANGTMIAELRTVRTESPAARRGTSADFPYLFIPRRIQNTTNASYRPKGVLKTPYNPAYMHGSDLERLGVREGDLVEVRSKHGSVVGVAGADNDLRPGVLSMCHGYGRNPGEASDPRRDGVNVNRLLHWEDDYDPYHGMPRMGALPVSVRPVSAA